MIHLLQKRGFTLLEVLLVVALVGILAAIVIIAINPQRQLGLTRDVRRESDIMSIYNSLEQYRVRERSYPEGVTGEYQELCSQNATDCSGLLDIRDDLTPDYIAQIPQSPGSTGNGSGYEIAIHPFNNRMSIRSNTAELRDVVINDIDLRPFIITVQTDGPGISNDNQFILSTRNTATYDFQVDWGDGNIDFGVTGDITHTYDEPGTYDIAISGQFPQASFNTVMSDRLKVMDIKQWGDIAWASFEGAFSGSSNMTMTALDSPDLSNVSSMYNAFAGTLSFNGDVSNWDVSNVTDMRRVFIGAQSFNGDVSNWDVSNVTNMSGMFWMTSVFDGDISNWDVSNVTDMSQMFWNAINFNTDLSGWCVSNITTEPSQFDDNTPAWTLPRPVWGTCP